ncbi:hypothetical protein [Nonomuraea sp. NPDC049725]|uniref:hypothetical protein n=1 Tax=Nonomuraea sp. NPDC049725 TaxID=3154508 RepID=UPI003449830D
MRPFEIVLVVVEALAFWRSRASVLFALGIPVAVVAQVLVEGARWPMAPAYALAAALTAVCACRARAVLGPVVMAVVMVTVMVVVVAVPVLLPVFRFPQPTGPHEVGTLTYHWTDHSRREILGSDPGAPRELMAQIWYPAQADPAARRAAYVQDGPLVDGIARVLGAPGITFRHLRQVRTNAVAGAPAAPGRHPVLVFLSGAQGFRQSNTFQVEELASPAARTPPQTQGRRFVHRVHRAYAGRDDPVGGGGEGALCLRCGVAYLGITAALPYFFPW